MLLLLYTSLYFSLFELLHTNILANLCFGRCYYRKKNVQLELLSELLSWIINHHLVNRFRNSSALWCKMTSNQAVEHFIVERSYMMHLVNKVLHLNSTQKIFGREHTGKLACASCLTRTELLSSATPKANDPNEQDLHRCWP